MKSSQISLFNLSEGNITEDSRAKSISFFCKRRPVLINKDVIAEMKAISKMRGNKNIRVCLHDSPKSKHHDMIILEHGNILYPPHKHLYKGEAFHVIEGILSVFAFDSKGGIIDCVKLQPSDIYRVEVGMFHAVLPISDIVIYHENKPGPFLGNGDSVFPDWIPSPDNINEMEKYKNRLLKTIKNIEKE